MRTVLPTRRRSVTREVEYSGMPFTVTVGYDKAGAPKEVFADGVHNGSAMAVIISDACVLVSVALQHGITPPELGKSLGRVPCGSFLGVTSDRAASPLGVIVEVASTPLADVVSDIQEAI